MRIGIGGGAFGVRGGISNRGFGVGVGPLSAGSSWGGRRSRRSSNSGEGLALLIAFGLMVAVALWPYWFGTYLATQMGADNPSPARTVAGWVFEIPWLLFLVFAVVQTVRRRSERVAQEANYQAPRAVQAGRSVVFHHGACTINHRTADAASRCRGG